MSATLGKRDRPQGEEANGVKKQKLIDPKEQRTRPTKPDFAPTAARHRAVMEKAGLETEKLIELRHHFHKYPEGGFKEFKTQEKIKETLLGFGLPEDALTVCAKTGYYVDIKGTGPASDDGPVKAVALRTDIDALPIPEGNEGLEYRSTTDHAHMCGHDGHMATLLSAAQVFCKNRDKIPSNKFVRLLCQPAEEGPGGAEPMIKEGCLEGVDEVYGYHNVPNFDTGDVRACEGYCMAAVTMVKIKITGQGGHGSTPHKLRDPITAATMVHQALNSIKSRNIDSRENIVFTICRLTSGHTHNVFPNEAEMEGTIRSFDPETLKVMKERIESICKNVAKAFMCEAEVELEDMYPPVKNHPEQTQRVIALAKQHFGEENFSQAEIPLLASEDFSYFLQEKPGCFFFLGSMREGEPIQVLHSSEMNYNDLLIPSGGLLYVRIVEDRLGVKILE